MKIQKTVGSIRRKLLRINAKLNQVRVRPSDSGASESSKSARVTVVIPVFNAMPYLEELATSLKNQDLDPKLFEVLVVDDGSTDGGGKFVDAFAATQSNWRVIRQRNSGWPGKPRNVGIDSSTSDYLFFCDADDIVAPAALSRMLEFADRHTVDVLAPQMVGIGGRRVAAGLYSTTMSDAPLRHILETLSPQKLIRRSLLQENSIRFPEGRVRLEDGIFMTRCYLASKRNSILADYEYYYLRSRDDGTNIGAQGTVPEDYTRSVDKIARIIKENHHDSREADLLVLDLYRRKILRTYVPDRFSGMSFRRRTRWLEAHAAFISEHISTELEKYLEFPFLHRSNLARAKDNGALLQLAHTEKSLKANCRTIDFVPADVELWFEMESPAIYDSAHLLAFARGNPTPLIFELRRKGSTYGLALPTNELVQLGNSIIDFYVQLQLGGILGPKRRIHSPANGTSLGHPSIRIYTTIKGHLSLDQRSQI